MKPSLVIIPGWGGTRAPWKAFLTLASYDFDVHFIDMPGFGDVPCPKTVWGVEDYAAYVLQSVQNIEKPILLGHSFGGQIAVNIVARYPERFSHLILSGAAAIRPKHTLRRFFFFLIAKTGKFITKFPLLRQLESLAKKALYKIANSPDYTHTSDIKRAIFTRVIRESQTKLLPNIPIPTLVVWGDRDRYVPLREGRLIARLIPNASLVIIKGGPHGLHVRQPENLLRIIRDFLTS